MNRLQLVRTLAIECGVSGVVSTTEGTQQGEDARLINWIDRAWQAVQTKQNDWQWMRSSNMVGEGISFTTIDGDYDYPLGTGPGTVGVEAANFTKWDVNSFRIFTTARGYHDEYAMGPISYDAWRDGYMFGAQRSVRTRPVVIAVGPNNMLVLAPPPTAGYTVTGDYYLAPSAMTLDTSTPLGLPAQYHMVIVYLAMTYYAGYESAPEVLDRGQTGYAQMMRQLAREQGQALGIAEALA